MKRLLSTIVLSAFGLLMVPHLGAAAQTTDPASIFTAFLNAEISSDPASALPLLSDDAVVRIIPAPPGSPGVWTGKAEIVQWLQFVKSQSPSQERIGSPAVSGNKVTQTVLVTVNDFRKWGIGPVEHTFEAVIENGKVKSFVSTMAVSERGRVGAAAAAYQASQSGQAPAGMPRTGESQGSVVLWLLATMGALVAALGLRVRRNTRVRTG